MEFPWEIVFGVISRNYLIFSLKLKCKQVCKIPKIVLVPEFCPLKTEITGLLILFSEIKTYRNAVNMNDRS